MHLFLFANTQLHNFSIYNTSTLLITPSLYCSSRYNTHSSNSNHFVPNTIFSALFPNASHIFQTPTSSSYQMRYTLLFTSAVLATSILAYESSSGDSWGISSGSSDDNSWSGSYGSGSSKPPCSSSSCSSSYSGSGSYTSSESDSWGSPNSGSSSGSWDSYDSGSSSECSSNCGDNNSKMSKSETTKAYTKSAEIEISKTRASWSEEATTSCKETTIKDSYSKTVAVSYETETKTTITAKEETTKEHTTKTQVYAVSPPTSNQIQ